MTVIFSGIAPLNPFLSTIAKQRGIPVFIIGIIFTFMPIFNIIARPITGYVTDRWRCRKQVFLSASFINAFVTLLIHFTPDFNDLKLTQDIDILMHWKFWIFVAVITLRMLLWMVGDVLQDTICLEILGKRLNYKDIIINGSELIQNIDYLRFRG